MGFTYIMHLSSQMCRTRKLRGGSQGLGGEDRGVGKLLLKGGEVLVQGDEVVPDMDGGEWTAHLRDD